MVHKRTLSAALLHIMCAVALMMIGFAHKPVPSLLPEVQFAAYLLPDGKLPSLCVTDTGDEPGKNLPHHSGCDACRLSGAILLSEPPTVTLLVAELAAAAAVLERYFHLHPRLHPPSSGPRAPPSSV